MLARAAGRKLRRETSRVPSTLADQLTLPWLCPALTRWTSHARPISTTSSKSTLTASATATATHTQEARQQRPRRASLSSRRSTRSIVTTADAQPALTYDPHQQWGRHMPLQSLSRLPAWDGSSPLVVRDALAAMPSVRAVAGIVGDPIELHQTLHACLRVGRLDRGAVIMKRLTALYNPASHEAIDAHNTYLQALLEFGQRGADGTALKAVEQWYDKQMVRHGVRPNAQTFVILVRAAMNFLDGNAQEEKIRSYLAEAHNYGPHLVDDVNSSPEFTDEEWDALIRLQPETYQEPPSVQEVQSLHVDTPAGRENLVNHGLHPISVDSIKPVLQKGVGLDSLKQALGMFDNETNEANISSPHDSVATQKDKNLVDAMTKQLQLERNALEAAVQRWKHDNDKLENMGIHGVLKTKPVQAIMYNWYTALVPLFKKEIERSRLVLSGPASGNTKDDAHAYGAWLERCTPESLAAITVGRITQTAVRDRKEEVIGQKISATSISIGCDIEDYLNGDVQHRRNIYLKKQRKLTRKDLVNQLSRGGAATNAPQSDDTLPEWLMTDNVEIPLPVRTKLGAMCIANILQAATIDVTVDDAKTGKTLTKTLAAFSHQIGFHNGKKIGVIIPHHVVLEKLRSEPVCGVSMMKLPMVAQPRPWTGYDQGGYYTRPENVVRQKNSDKAQRAYAQSAIANGDMKQVLTGLDVLGKVPWKINRPVLDVMVQVWNSGEGVGAMVPENLNLEPPQEPSSDAPLTEKRKWVADLKQYQNDKSGIHSQRCFNNFQLETAKSFVNEEKIFFPHSVDFRGRAYPIPPILNHIGSDLPRGLLLFANGKELGTVGLQWLKIHIANLYGFDKASLREREQFATDNIDEIYDSALKPLDGRKWWTKAEDPWQCLACCMELHAALESPDPTRYVSRMPVHQDGTCNGLQHYAALGGDLAGARQVNLEPSDRPQDIYTGVAELVKEMVAQDVLHGSKIAKLIDGHITRKVVKRTVMTNVYGVTFMGAKQQVQDELRNIFPNFKGTEEVQRLSSVALYVASKIFQALGKIFNGAQEIQYWLGECGDRITSSISAEQIRRIGLRSRECEIPVYDEAFNQPKVVTKSMRSKMIKGMESFRTSIIWTTPLKMPIVQPYRKDGSTVIKTKVQDITVTRRSMVDEVDKRKQLQAFPPNFIHSLDASHMILSAIKASEMGLDFAAVHDSFWTHASDIPALNTILRDAFVRMHSEDIIGRLHAEFTARYKGAMYKANIRTSSIAAQLIMEWRLNSRRLAGQTLRSLKGRPGNAGWDEVAIEARRQELLASDDPEKRQEGENMVTPTSIWLAHQDPKALHSSRMSLLGETKGRKATTRQQEVRDKVLSAETDVINNDTASANNVEPAFKLPAEEQVEPAEHSASEADEEDLPNAVSDATLQVWIPLTFPPVPEKGDWDVSRLRESKYFFS